LTNETWQAGVPISYPFGTAGAAGGAGAIMQVKVKKRTKRTVFIFV
jgi:hypothetical protein